MFSYTTLRSSILFAVFLFPMYAWGQTSQTPLSEIREDIRNVQETIFTEPEVASAWVASTSALEKWIEHKDYIDVIEGIQSAYQYRNPELVSQELNRRKEIIGADEENWAGWLDASILARSIGDFQGALTSLDNAVACPNCVVTPGVRVLRGITHLDLHDVDKAEVEYASAVLMASQSNDPAMMFRVRQAFADDLYDHGYHDEGVARGYVCKDSDYPLEKAWAHALEIVYLWSKDRIEDVSQTVSDLSLLLPQVTWVEDSGWERNRYRQAEGLLGIAQGALAEDPLSKMILDVEATEFHYKRGELEKAFNRLEPWVRTYPTSRHATFSDGEKEWSLWAKYNYCLMLCAILRLDEAEDILNEILQTASEGENTNLIAMCWCVLGQTLSLQGKEREATLAYGTGLDLDTSEIDSIPEGVSDLRSQPYIAGGHMLGGLRTSFVREYQVILSKEGE